MMPSSSGCTMPQNPQPSSSDLGVTHSSKIRVIFDSMTFDDLQRNRLRDMERRIEAETRRKGKHWKKEIERMRKEFLELEPVYSDSGGTVNNDPGLTNSSSENHRTVTDEAVDPTRMRTSFLDYPDTGRRFKVRFNMVGFNRRSIVVHTVAKKIEVRATRLVEQENGDPEERQFLRRVEKPPEVDPSKLKSYLTVDDILIVEAPLAPSSLDLGHVIRRSASSGSGHHQSSSLNNCHSSSPSNNSGSPGTPSGNPGIKEKYGVPIFREEDGCRRMHLIVDIGTAFQANDIFVQVLKENKILVKAKHESKSVNLSSKHKFCKEFELNEKIETQTLRGGLQDDGKLIVSAFVKISKKKKLLQRNSASANSNLNTEPQIQTLEEKSALEKSGDAICCTNTVIEVSETQTSEETDDRD